MKYLLASLLSISALLQASENTPKFPSILVYTSISISAPYIMDAAEALKLHKQAKAYDFKSSKKSIQNLQSTLVNSKEIATPEWNVACKNLNELIAQEKAVQNHLNFLKCFESAQKQASPLKLSLRTLGVMGFVMCMYKQAKG